MVDIAGAIAEGISGFWRTHKMGQWFLDLFGVHLAMLCSFCGGTGYQLYYQHQGFAISIGFGLMLVPGAAISVVTSNPRLRGMVTGWWIAPQIPTEAGNIEVDKVDPK